MSYIKALKSVGVKVMLGKFKGKHKRCNKCRAKWVAHEEKETDVNIALNILNHAYLDIYDKAVIVSGDSDFSPSIRMVKKHFPNKEFKILTPVNRKHSWDLVNTAGGKSNASHIKEIHLERALFPKEVTYKNEIIYRQTPYKPPSE